MYIYYRVRYKNIKVTMSLAYLSNVRLPEYWMGQTRAQPDYRESSVFQLKYL